MKSRFTAQEAPRPDTSPCNFVTEYRDRYFWMSTNGKFAGGNFRFDVIGKLGRFKEWQLFGHKGFEYRNDVSYALQYRFVRLDSGQRDGLPLLPVLQHGEPLEPP
ncbi:UNVERIFIED_CONTAM: hypothetical protein FKN15_065029 [Acipenser sinensis]